MDNLRINLQNLLFFISQQIHTFVHQYDTELNLEYSICERHNFEDSLINDKGFIHKVFSYATASSPDIIDINHNICYAAVKTDYKYFLLGPVRLSGPVFLRTYLNLPDISDENTENNSEISLRHFIRYTLLLHNLFAKNALSEDNFIISILSNNKYHQSIQRNFNSIIFENQENHTRHNPYEQEIREMDSIRSGDIERLRQSWEEDYIGSFGVLGPTRLRSYKNLGIIITILASRAAIQGGVHPEIAFSLADSYCQKIEEALDETVAGELGRHAEIQFTTMVQQIKEERKINSPTSSAKFNQCKDYIFSHLHDKLTVADIAGELNIHPNYLSALFKQHEGVSITQYILQEKIKLVQNMLMYSTYSYSDIANYLGFSSQSYLGATFKKITGYTLKKYREQYGYSDDIRSRA